MVKNAGFCAEHEMKDCGASVQCPNCHYRIDNTDVSCDWPGFPAGIKFDPSDVELLQHLAAKCGVGDLEPHKFIDEYILTLKGDEGICYTHPENLPGVKRDGGSVHFFYRISNAYASGKRKRRKIQDQESELTTNVRWHKTGKTKVVMENGTHRGYKKIMVLYSTTKNGSKSEKCNWIMHQYHLGTEEDEKEGEFVVAKIFYQTRKESDHKNASVPILVISESDMGMVQLIPKTPNMSTEKTSISDFGADDYFSPSLFQDVYKNGPDYTNSCLVGESQAADLDEIDFLLCDKVVYSDYAATGEFKHKNAVLNEDGSKKVDVHKIFDNAFRGISDLENIEIDTPPDFQLNDLQFASQDSLFDNILV